MKNRIYSLAKVMLLSLLIADGFTSALSAEENTIRLGYSDVEAFPYQIRADNGPPGIALEIISEAAEQTGIKIIYVRLPNKRVQNSLKEGDLIDGAFMFSYNDERRAYSVYPLMKGKPDGRRRIATLSYYIYRKKGSALNWDGKNFSGIDFSDSKKSIGANSGYSIVNDLVKKGVPVDDGSKTTEQNFLKLQTERISGFAHQSLVADNYILSSGIANIEKLPKPFIQKDYFLIFSNQYYQKNRKTAEKLWKKIGEIREKKTSSVLSKYSD